MTLKLLVLCSLLATITVAFRYGAKMTSNTKTNMMRDSIPKAIASFGIASSLLGGVVNVNAATVPSSGTHFAQTQVTTFQIAAADPIPSLGAAAPDFSLPSNTGKSISLADLKGSRTVLYFYPGDFTSGCTIEAQAFQRDFPKYKILSSKPQSRKRKLYVDQNGSKLCLFRP